MLHTNAAQATGLVPTFYALCYRWASISGGTLLDANTHAVGPSIAHSTSVGASLHGCLGGSGEGAKSAPDIPGSGHSLVDKQRDGGTIMTSDIERSAGSPTLRPGSPAIAALDFQQPPPHLAVRRRNCTVPRSACQLDLVQVASTSAAQGAPSPENRTSEIMAERTVPSGQLLADCGRSGLQTPRGLILPVAVGPAKRRTWRMLKLLASVVGLVPRPDSADQGSGVTTPKTNNSDGSYSRSLAHPPTLPLRQKTWKVARARVGMAVRLMHGTLSHGVQKAVHDWIAARLVKSPARAAAKAAGCYSGDVSHLLDVCRARLSFNSVDSLAACVQVVTAAPGVRLVRVKNLMQLASDSWWTAGFRVSNDAVQSILI